MIRSSIVGLDWMEISVWADSMSTAFCGANKNLKSVSSNGHCFQRNVTSCNCHVFVAPPKLWILSIATDGTRFFGL